MARNMSKMPAKYLKHTTWELKLQRSDLFYFIFCLNLLLYLFCILLFLKAIFFHLNSFSVLCFKSKQISQ